MEGACSAYDNWYNFDVGFEGTMGLQGLFQWFVYGVDVVYNVCDVAISGVFALYKLELSTSSVSGILFIVYPTARMMSCLWWVSLY